MYTKKVLILVFLIISLLFLTSCEQKQEPELNETEPLLPKVRGADYYYCTGLGYKYEMRIENNTHYEYCMFPNGEECDAFDFIGGECGREFTLCNIKGYTLKIGVEQHEGFNATYAICIFPDRSYCKEIDFFNRKCHVKW
ncbi:hypothetical protein A3K72_04185 [Candidatus Woesearchaeota archaeon RBG_13_36_6]|nr:MAG: hypothetical protein A3K72_04185 [Candidatus Woesearchaeota archaeon RBG_13_36_6]